MTMGQIPYRWTPRSKFVARHRGGWERFAGSIRGPAFDGNSPKLGVLGLRRPEHGNVGIGVFPQAKKLFVGRLGL
jgi:hypothetical protein